MKSNRRESHRIKGHNPNQNRSKGNYFGKGKKKSQSDCGRTRKMPGFFWKRNH